MRSVLFLFITFYSFNESLGQNLPAGQYVGFEKICMRQTKKDSCDNRDHYNKRSKWFHLSTMKFKGDSVFLDQSPVQISKKDTIYSASDGGFYFYKGTWKKLSETHFVITLREVFCDYCGEIVRKNEDGIAERVFRTKNYMCTWSKDGFLANGLVYKNSTNEKNMLSEHWWLFTGE